MADPILTVDPDHPGLYLITGPGLEADPDHPGLYRITGAGLAREQGHPGLLRIVDPGVFTLDPVIGQTWVTADTIGPGGPGVRELYPEVITSYPQTVIVDMAPGVAHPLVGFAPETIAGDTTVTAALAHIPRTFSFTPDPARGRTAARAHVAGLVSLSPDTVSGGSNVRVRMDLAARSYVDLFPEIVHGVTVPRIVSFPDLSRNAPILLGFTATVRLESIEPQRAGEITGRAVAGRVVDLPEPVVSDGQPSLPYFWARFAADATLIEGPAHIHAIADPNPAWDPRTGGWTFPPVATSAGDGAGDFRWAMDTLPDPAGFKNGWYWLGDDGGGGTPAGAHTWPTSPGSKAGGPAWRSFYPFRPSVSAYDGYIPGEKKIHHAKGVHVNSHYAEHMWLDFGADQRQPFTWIVVATVMSDPFAGYQHNLLDAGHNPDDVGFPRISANAVSKERRINDNLPYRTSLSVVGDTAQLTTSIDAPLRTKGAPGHHPRMYAAIVDGAGPSRLAAYDPFGKYLAAGSVRNESPFTHRFTVLGREQSWISQRHTSNVLIFEIRYWHRALTVAELDAQYAQLSSTHQFDAYKRL